MPSQDRINAFVEQLEADGELATGLELDAVTTLRDMGFDDLIATVEQERDRIGALVDRIYRDDAFRRAVEDDPTGELTGLGIPEVAIGSVLVLAGAPDEVVDRATADFEAHLLGRKPATVAALAAMLGTLAFAQQASAGTQSTATSAEVASAAQAQVASAAQAQVASAAQAQVASAAQAHVTSAAQTQISPEAKAEAAPAAQAQISKAQVRWQRVQPDRLKAQGALAALLRAQGSGL